MYAIASTVEVMADGVWVITNSGLANRRGNGEQAMYIYLIVS